MFSDNFEPKDHHILIWLVARRGMVFGFITGMWCVPLALFTTLELYSVSHLFGSGENIYSGVAIAFPVFGGTLGGFVGFATGIAVAFLRPRKLYHLVLMALAVGVAFPMSFLCFIAFFGNYSIDERSYLLVSFNGAIIASVLAAFFGYQIATWRKRAKKKKTRLVSETN